MAELLHDLILESAARTPAAPALRYCAEELDYAALARQVQQAADGLLALGLQAQERVAVWLDKRIETVTALFGASLAGLVLVPVNPLLRAGQAAYILRHCNARVLVTSAERLVALSPLLRDLGPLPRNPNGKIDRRLLAGELAQLLAEVAAEVAPMSGLCGWFSHDPGALPIEQMAAPLCRFDRAPLRVGAHGAGALALAADAASASFLHDNALLVASWGEPAETVARLWRSHGPKACSALSGSFVFAVLDEKRDEAYLAVDRSG